MDLGPSSDGRKHGLWVGLEYEHVEPVTINVRIDSTARDSPVTWTRDLTLSASWPPPVTATRPRINRNFAPRPFIP